MWPFYTIKLTYGKEFRLIDISLFQLHNDYRQQVLNGEIDGLPKAKFMNVLKWDPDLEKEAQRYSEPFTTFNFVYDFYSE